MSEESLESILQRYPRLENVRGKVPDDVLLAELASKVAAYEGMSKEIREHLPSKKLVEVLPPDVERGEISLIDCLGQWGNVTVEELCKLCLIVRWKRPKKVFEFGTFNGVTTRQLARNAPADCRVITLDLDPDRPPPDLDVGQVDGMLARKMGAFDVEVGSRFRSTPEAAKIEQHFGDSTNFDFSRWERSIDVVFVDAGHTYRYVQADSRSAFGMVASGGIVVWHDALQVMHPDVTRCLLDLSKEGRTIRHLRGTNLAIYTEP